MSIKNIDKIAILHVDDDFSILETVKLILTEMDNNLKIDSANSVNEALEILKTKKYDAIISDYEMPIKNGLDLLKELKEKHDQTPFILFTGKGKEEVAIQALNLGADHYLNKLGDPEVVYKELIQSIHQLYDKTQARNLLLENKGLLIENMPDGIILVDFNGKIIDGNRHLQELLGCKKEEIVGRNIQDLGFTSQENISIIMKKSADASIGLTTAPTECTLKRKDGVNGFVEITVFPVQLDDEAVIMGVTRDITQRKKAETELEQKYEILESVTKSTDSGLGIISKDYDVVWVNSALQPVMDKRGGPNKKCYQIFNDLDSVCPECGIKKVFEQNLSLAVREYSYKIEENGPTLWVELRSTPLKDRNGNIIAGLELSVPITERKKAQEALKESEARYRMITENMQDTISITDFQGNIVYVSPSMERVFGYSVDEFIGKNANTLIHPDDVKNVIGPNLPLVISGKEYPPFEVRLLTKSGQYLWIECTVRITKDAEDKLRLIIVKRNIEARKKVEQNLAIVNEKLQVVGKLTRHDVRNKLTVIMSNLYLLKKKYGDNPELTSYLENIEQAITMSNRIFEFSRIYEQIGAEKQTEIDVKNCFNEAVALFQKPINIKIINQTEGLIVVADSLLRQLFYNLIDNSVKHGRKVTEIRLFSIKKEGQTKLFYEDNGVGVPLENKTKLFNEGFSTDGGTGLGLSMIKKMMEVYRWSIIETGSPGEGVRFEITIPNTKE